MVEKERREGRRKGRRGRKKESAGETALFSLVTL